MSQAGVAASLLGDQIDDNANSLILWGTSTGRWVRQVSGRGTLGTTQRLGDQPGSALLAMAPTGHAAVAWTEVISTPAEISTTVMVATSSPLHIFGAPKAVTTFREPATTFALGPRDLGVAIGPTGQVAVSWVQGGQGIDGAESDYVNGDVFIATAQPGETFGAPQQLAAGRTPDVAPTLAFSTAGALIVGWAEASTPGRQVPDSVHSAYSLHGTQFGTRQQVGSAAGVRNLDSAFDDRGTATVGWLAQTADSPTDPTAARRRRGHAFDPARTLASTVASHISLEGGGRGTTVATWEVPSLRLVETSIYLP